MAGAVTRRAAKTLDRMLSKVGAASRSDARGLVAAGRVSVNGRVVRDPGVWIDPARDRLALDGRPLAVAKRVYLLVYKPRGYLTTRRDKAGRKTVYDLIGARDGHVFPAGRLDLDTSGILVMTNDAALAERLTSPDHAVPKTYLVKSSMHLDDAQLGLLRAGLVLRDGPTRPARVERLRERGGRTVFEITITEGRNRQVRRMVEALGAKVLKLVRVAIGPLRIGTLPIGGWRELTREEVRALTSSRS